MKHFGKIILGISVFVCLFAGLYCLINPIAEQFEFDFDSITMEVGDYSGINYRIYPTSVEDYCYIQGKVQMKVLQKFCRAQFMQKELEKQQ